MRLLLAAVLLCIPLATAGPAVCIAGTCTPSLPLAPPEPPQPEPPIAPPEPDPAPPPPEPDPTPTSAPEATVATLPGETSAQGPAAAGAASRSSTGGIGYEGAVASWTTLGALLLGLATATQGRLVSGAARGAMLGIGGWFGLRLFSRIDGPKVLEHPTRAALADLIVRAPGIHVEDMRRRLGISTSTALHHLHRLHANGLVVVSRDDGLRRYYLAATPQSHARHDVTVLRQATRARIARLVLRHPDISQADIVARIGIGKAGASKHLKVLETAGMVEGRPDGRMRRYGPTSRLEQTLMLLDPDATRAATPMSISAAAAVAGLPRGPDGVPAWHRGAPMAVTA